MTTTTPRRGIWRRSVRRRGARAGLAVLALTAGMAAFAPAALAQTDSQGDGAQSEQGGGRHGRPQLTDEQKACLEEAGVEKPAEGQRPTDAQREAFKAAAQKCGIPLPRHPHLQLTDEQKACLEEAGVEKPAEGQRPTDAQREAFRAAAEQCGIDLPERPPAGDDGSGGQDGGSQDGAQNQSTSV